MSLDLELYRRLIRVSAEPLVRLSVVDVFPDHPQRTILFIHGYGGNARQWQYQLREFSFNNRVIAIDLRGHGRSDKPDGPFAIDQILEDLKKTLEALEVDGSFVLVGHSFGGAIATEFAHKYPHRIEQLILIASAGEYKLNPIYRALLRLPLPFLRAMGPFVRSWLSAPPQVMHAWYHNIIAKWSGWNLFRGLKVPTLVIRGHLDIVFEKPAFEEVARAIPDAEEIDVGASGHLVMLERREAVNRAIQRQLEKRRPTQRQGKRTTGSDRSRLVQERIWLRNYDQDVPYTIAVPRIPLTQLLSSSAHRFALRTALIFEGARITYRRLNHEANRFANALRSLGVDKGDRVMLLLPNLPQLVVAFYGTLKAGGVVVFTLPTTNTEEIMRQIRLCDVRILVTLTLFDDLVNQIRETLSSNEKSSLEHIILTNLSDYLPSMKRLAIQLTPSKRKRYHRKMPRDANLHAYSRLLYSHPSRSPGVLVSPDEPAVIQFTGGTTAIPKGVTLSHRNLVANAIQTRHWFPQAQEGKERFLSVLPFSHIYGLTTALNVPVAFGATLILKPTFETEDILRTIKRHRPTIFPGVPNMYLALKDFPGVRKYGISSIKACISGSAPLPVEVQEAFEKLTRGRLVEGYGLTEAAPVTHGNPLFGRRKIGNIGIPLPSTEARVVDLKKGEKTVRAGQIGELAVRGPQVMLGYWQDPEGSQRVITPEGWLLTGDVAQMDEDGYFRIIARKADMWYPDKPGKPAFPRDIEEVLFEVPQVKEAAVVVVANQPIAFIISQKERPQAEALISYCKRRLPPELVPRLVIFVDDFPRTFIGKVLRRELAKRVNQEREEPSV